MPLYEYQCDACGGRFEVIQKFSDPPAETCSTCGKGPVQRLISSPAIQFKGSGWYITDYSQKGKPSGESAGAEKSEKTEKSDKAEKKDAGASADKDSKSSSTSDSSSGGGAGTAKPTTPAA